MRINLLRDSNNIRNGYLNIDNFVGENKAQGDVTNLDPLVDDGTAEEIIANNILEYYEYGKSANILNNWLKKLRHGGVLTIITTDYRAVCKAVLREVITPAESLPFLYGTQTSSLMYKKSGYTLDILQNVFTQAGLNITKVNLSNLQISISGERP